MQRLKTRAQFQAVLAGATVARSAHFALHRMEFTVPPAPAGSEPNNSPSLVQTLFAARDHACEPWIGCMLPKRWAKRAVTRNAIKRQIYAVSAALSPPLPAAAHIVRLRSGFDRKLFVSAESDALKAAVRAELQTLFARAAR